ncbi:MAG TPA: tetratricopeptide repeat protein [Terriglobales bacterium]|jgi:tetratricopeptide (TPR) repeat protein|nr:tetratricopeptide repeat protein [Terriglobales bacterium]
MISLGIRLLSFVLVNALISFGQTPANQVPGTAPPTTPAAQTPGTAPTNQSPKPDTVAPPAKGAQAAGTSTGGKQATDSTPAEKRDRAQAYYHYALAHMYEEMVSVYGHSEYSSKAIDEYKLALQNDPGSEQLNAGLAELYFKTGHIRDAVTESQEIIKRDPNNLDARKLLGRIYLRSIGDMSGGAQSSEVLKLAIEQFSEIVKLEPDKVDDHLLLGRLYIINKDYLKAEGEFKAARQIQPDSEEAIINLAYLYNEEGDTKKAVEVLQSLPEAQRSGKLYAVLGYTFEQQKEFKRAITAYQHALDQDKDNLDALRGLANSLLGDNQVDAALAQYKLVADADPQDAQAYLRMSEIYRRQGKYNEAMATLKKAEALVQDSLEVPYNEALIDEAQGKFDEAIQILQGLVEKSAKPVSTLSSNERNNRSVFLERLGTIYRETGRNQQAIETFRKMIELGDESAERGYSQVIDTHREDKQWNQAITVAQDAVKALPKDRSMRLVLAQQLADNGKADEGIAMIKAELKGTAEDREVLLALSQIYGRLRRWSDADDALTKADALATKPEEKQYDFFLRGSYLERQKKYEPAEEMFRKVLATDARNAMALNYLGYMLADRGVRLEEALGLIKKAVQEEPQNGAYLDSLGWAYFKMGNYDLAEETLRKAIEHISKDPTVHDHLGEVYAKTGRLKLAAAQWERALEEWNRSLPADVESNDVARVQKQLESTKVKLAKQEGAKD